MADKANTSQGTGAAPAVDSPDAIRNVVLVGPSGSGKTTLVEALLVASGVLNRPGTVLDGTTVCDFDDAEIRQQRSVGLSLASLPHDGVKVNLIDTPGYADFVGELRAGLRAADCALFVISASEGVDEPTKALWQECDQVGMPRAVVVTKLDHARANYQNALATAQAAFGDKVLPLYLPAGDGLIGLLSQTYYGYAGGKRSTSAPDASYDDQIEELRGTLIEGIIEESEDESLMDRYLEGEEIDQKVLIDDLERAVARGSFFPVIPVCSASGVGTFELLEVATSGFPSPLEHTLPEVFSPHGVRAQGPDLRPGRAAAGRGGEDDVGSVRRQGQPGAGVLRHHQARHDGSRVGPFHVLLRCAELAHRSRRGRADRLAVVPAGQGAAAGAGRGRGRSVRDRAADQGGDRRHAVRQGGPTAAEAVDDARAVAADRRPGAREDRRGQAEWSGCSGWRPRTRRSGSSRTRRPTRSCSGAWARPTPTSYSTPWPTGTA